MSEETKKLILFALRQQVNNAYDNLYRARRCFEGASENVMKQPYGQSGQTRQDILDSYEQDYEKCRKALKEVEEWIG